MPANNVYTVDWNKLVRMLVPPFLRKPKLLSYLYVLIAPIALIHNLFLLFRKNVKYRLSITSQVCRLEKLLNDRWDIQQRRIFINRGINYEPVFLALDVEDYPVMLPIDGEGFIELPTDAETSFFSVDFTINIPLSVVFDERELRAYIADDVLPSKVYNVKTF